MTTRKQLAVLTLAALLAPPLTVSATCTFDEAQADCPGHCPMSQHPVSQSSSSSSGPALGPSEEPCCELTSPAPAPPAASPVLLLSNGTVAPVMLEVTLPGKKPEPSPALTAGPAPAPASASSPQALLCVFLL